MLRFTVRSRFSLVAFLMQLVFPHQVVFSHGVGFLSFPHQVVVLLEVKLSLRIALPPQVPFRCSRDAFQHQVSFSHQAAFSHQVSFPPSGRLFSSGSVSLPSCVSSPSENHETFLPNVFFRIEIILRTKEVVNGMRIYCGE